MSEQSVIVVWREKRWPFQWIGMCPRHSGGIRCNDKAQAEAFMADLCAQLHATPPAADTTEGGEGR